MGKVTFHSQFTANFLKNGTLLLRSKKLLVFQIIISVVLLVLMGVLGITILNTFIPSGDQEPTTDFRTISSDNFYWHRARNFTYFDETGIAGGPLLNDYTRRNENLGKGVMSSFFQRNGVQPPNYETTERFNVSPIAMPLTEASQVNQVFVDSFLAYKEQREACSDSSFCVSLPFDAPTAGVIFHEISNTTFRITVEADINVRNGYPPEGYSIRKPSEHLGVSIEASSVFTAAFYRWISNYNYEANGCDNTTSFGCRLFEFNTELTSAIVTYPQAFRVQLHMAAIYFALVFAMPMFMYRTVSERNSGLISMMNSMGLGPVAYWSTNLVSDTLIYLFLWIVVLVFGFGFQMDPITYRGPDSLFVYAGTLLFGPGLIAVSYAFSMLFSSPAKAVAFSYFLALIHFGGAWALSTFVFDPLVIAPVYYMFYPPFALWRIIFVTAYHVTYPSLITWDQVQTQGLYSLLYLVAFTFLFFWLVVWLDSVLPKKGAQRKTVCFCFLQCCAGKTSMSDEDYPDVELEEPEDEDVAEERRLVHSDTLTGNEPLIIGGIKKVFNSAGYTVKALNNVSFHVKSGEVFGLLGPNGAGKSTLVNILVGSEIPSSGKAIVGGFNVIAQPQEACLLVGLCPQHDVLWDDLSVEEHLLFYNRLKGVPRKEVSQLVRDTLKDLGLSGEKRRQAHGLSGGQKRRLSIGISMAGSPAVLILDEPSSGLDPASKRGLWDILEKLRHNRCLLLTTHSMEEAEVLCSRIGILSKGTLRCIGDKQRLKARFGRGYKIEISVDIANRDRVVAYISQLLPNAQLVAQSQSGLVFRAAHVKLSQVVEEIERNKSRTGIRNWGISQTSLDDVFFSIVAKDESLEDDEAGPLPNDGVVVDTIYD